MVACGLREEAIERARAHPEGRTCYTAWSTAELLADAGRTAEAVAFLQRHSAADSGILAWHLIGIGRVKDAVALVQQREPRPVVPPRTSVLDDEPPF